MVINDDYWTGKGKFRNYGVSSDKLSLRYKWPKKGVSLALEETIKLKLQKHQEWNAAAKENDFQRRLEIVKFMVCEWGGIRGNSEDTLKRYARLSGDEKTYQYMGVASYSKVLSIIDPFRFAILDARVVVSLNAIQILEKNREGVFFPYLSGRNNKTGNSLNRRGFSCNPRFRVDSPIFSKWIKPRRDVVYGIYIQTLKEAARRQRTDLFRLEMSLFADAESLAAQCEALHVADV